MRYNGPSSVAIVLTFLSVVSFLLSGTAIIRKLVEKY